MLIMKWFLDIINRDILFSFFFYLKITLLKIIYHFEKIKEVLINFFLILNFICTN